MIPFNPDIIMVESNQYQKMFADLLRDNGLNNVSERATTQIISMISK